MSTPSQPRGRRALVAPEPDRKLDDLLRELEAPVALMPMLLLLGTPAPQPAWSYVVQMG